MAERRAAPADERRSARIICSTPSGTRAGRAACSSCRRRRCTRSRDEPIDERRAAHARRRRTGCRSSRRICWPSAPAQDDGLDVVIARPFNHAGPRQIGGVRGVELRAADRAHRSRPRAAGDPRRQPRRPPRHHRRARRRRGLSAADGRRRAGRPVQHLFGPRVEDRRPARGAAALRARADHASRWIRTRLRPNDVPVVQGDASRIRAELGWAPKIPRRADAVGHARVVAQRDAAPDADRWPRPRKSAASSSTSSPALLRAPAALADVVAGGALARRRASLFNLVVLPRLVRPAVSPRRLGRRAGVGHRAVSAGGARARALLSVAARNRRGGVGRSSRPATACATLVGAHVRTAPLPWNRAKSVGGLAAFIVFGSARRRRRSPRGRRDAIDGAAVVDRRRAGASPALVGGVRRDRADPAERQHHRAGHGGRRAVVVEPRRRSASARVAAGCRRRDSLPALGAQRRRRRRRLARADGDGARARSRAP